MPKAKAKENATVKRGTFHLNYPKESSDCQKTRLPLSISEGRLCQYQSSFMNLQSVKLAHTGHLVNGHMDLLMDHGGSRKEQKTTGLSTL